MRVEVGGSRCGLCGREAAPGGSFCQFCGSPLAVLPSNPCQGCGTHNPPGTNFCHACGRSVVDQARVSLAEPDTGVAVSARLVAVRRDGSDGPSFPVDGDQVDLGRSEGELMFDDPHLAPRHARIIRRGNRFALVPLEIRNGIYIRLTGTTDIQDGDQILLGKQVLRFEAVPDVERSLRPAVEQGVVLFGTPVRPPWGRLRQMTSAGTTRDVYHLTRAEVVIGREQGDIVFSDDEFMSRRHAQIRMRVGRTELEDLGSSNGTYVRLRAQHPLTSGELIRMGDELLRFEIV